MSVQQARRLRKGATDAEKRLWSRLGNRQIGNLKFRRQHPFGNRVVDFFCEETKLAIELDGSGHLTGRGQTSNPDREIELLKKAFEFFVSTTTISSAISKAFWTQLSTQWIPNYRCGHSYA
jgi:very-short-patch-repair endonuclease